ncbi:MAG: hypothetical protein WCC92_05655 [Candidatus Korobacteraceae bacterium]
MKKIGLFTICLLFISSMVFAQLRPSGPATGQRIHPDGASGCSGEPILPTDGLATLDSVAGSSAAFYFVHLKDGHSYSAEVWDATDPAEVQGFSLSLMDFICGSTLSTTDVIAMDPDMSLMNADRISWIQSGDALDVLKMNNADTHFRSYTIRIVDTTLRNTRWSTTAGFGTHYGLLNTTESAISATLTAVESNGTHHVVDLTVPAGGELFEVIASDSGASSGLQLPANRAGYATLAYVGSPGALSVDGYFQAVQNGVIVLVSTPWAARNSQH